MTSPPQDPSIKYEIYTNTSKNWMVLQPRTRTNWTKALEQEVDQIREPIWSEERDGQFVKNGNKVLVREKVSVDTGRPIRENFIDHAAKSGRWPREAKGNTVSINEAKDATQSMDFAVGEVTTHVKFPNKHSHKATVVPEMDVKVSTTWGISLL